MNPILSITPGLLLDQPYLRKDAVIVFVCGKNISAVDSNRKVFFQYANKHFEDFIFLLAENFFECLEDKSENLLSIENKLADYSDCIIIILESESAFTELGAFSISDRLCKLILPINDRRYARSPSFINLGPLKKIDNISEGLGPTITANMKSFSHCFSSVRNRLEKIKRKNAKSISFTNINLFRNNHKERLLLLFEIISLFGPIKSNEIIDFFINKYGMIRLDEIHFDLPLLVALGISRKIDEYYISNKPGLSFIGFKKRNHFTTRSNIILYYKKYYPLRLQILNSSCDNAQQLKPN